MTKHTESTLREFRSVWRAAGTAVAFGGTAYCLVRLFFAETAVSMLGSGGLALLAFLAGIQLLNRRVVLTSSHLVRRRGLFGRRFVETPLQEITCVYSSYPEWSKAWNVGNIHVSVDGAQFQLSAVVDADGGTQEIRNAMSGLLSHAVP
jgi:hypothetical protein